MGCPRPADGDAGRLPQRGSGSPPPEGGGAHDPSPGRAPWAAGAARHPLRLGGLELGSPLLLAPLAGWTTLAFRETVRPLGGIGLAVTEVVSARSLRFGQGRTLALLRTSPADRPLAAQISARSVDDARAAAAAVEDMGFAALDLNLGCPVRKIARKGGGAALGADPSGAAAIAAAAVSATRLPVTAKLRLGWAEDELTAPEVARALAAVGVAAITVHGRTRAQSFAGRASLEGIRAVREAVPGLPLIGNGDVLTADDALAMVRATGCDGVMIGRGAIEDPWIFRDAAALLAGGPRPPPPSLEERTAFVLRHYEALIAHEGEKTGTERFRKVLRTAGLSLGAGAAFAFAAVRVDGPAAVRALLDAVLGGAFPLAPPPRGGLVPAPKRPVDHW